MKNLIKTATRIVAAIAVCASVSACGQVNPAAASGSFPVYGSQASVSGQFVTPSIMDY